MKTVNFIEAVNSGKRFKYANCTKNEVHWYYDGTRLVNTVNKERYNPSLGDFNARFILEEQSITITESEFDAITDRAVFIDRTTFIDHIKKQLGFK